MSPEDITGHELRRRHIFQRSLREDFARHLCLSQLEQEAVLQHRIHLEGVSQTHLLLRQTGDQRQLLVDQVGSQHGVGLLDGIGRGQVVVLTRVDDYTGESVDYTRHELVDERTLHVDIAEQDTVECVVEHDVESLQCTHGCDFRHTETGTVVAKTDVAADLLAYFIQRLTHDAEVLLRSERTAESLGRSAVGHVVEQALSRGTDHGDDIGTLTGCRLCLYHILVDVTRSDNYVQIRFGAFAQRLQIVGATGFAGIDPLDAGVDCGLQGLLNLLYGMNGQFGQIQLSGCHLFGDLLRRETGLYHRIADEEQDTLSQSPLLLDLIDHHVGQRDSVLIHAVDSDQTTQCSLDGNRRIAIYKLLDVRRDLLRYRFGGFHLSKIKT